MLAIPVNMKLIPMEIFFAQMIVHPEVFVTKHQAVVIVLNIGMAKIVQHQSVQKIVLVMVIVLLLWTKSWVDQHLVVNAKLIGQVIGVHHQLALSVKMVFNVAVMQLDVSIEHVIVVLVTKVKIAVRKAVQTVVLIMVK